MSEEEALKELQAITGMSGADLQMTINIRYQGLDGSIKLSNIGKPIPVIVLENCFGNRKPEEVTGPKSLEGYEESVTMQVSKVKTFEEQVKSAEAVLLLSEGEDSEEVEMKKAEEERLRKRTTLIFAEDDVIAGIRIGEEIMLAGIPDTVPEKYRGRTFQRKDYQIKFLENGMLEVYKVEMPKKEKKASYFLDDKEKVL